MSFAALWVLTGITQEFYLVTAYASRRGWPYARWESTFRALGKERALVFIRYPPDWDGNLDLTYNQPDLAHAGLVRAIDKGARDEELMRYFPDRPAYVFDPSSLLLARIR